MLSFISSIAYGFSLTQNLFLEQREDLNSKLYQQGDILYEVQNTEPAEPVLVPPSHETGLRW